MNAIQAYYKWESLNKKLKVINNAISELYMVGLNDEAEYLEVTAFYKIKKERDELKEMLATTEIFKEIEGVNNDK